MHITTALIKQLREATGAGPLDCKKALEAHQGNLAGATDYLREKGMAAAARKATRKTGDGLVVVKAAGDTTCAVAVECETDFVARTADFKHLVHRLADQVLSDAALVDPASLAAAAFVDSPGQPTASVPREAIGRLGENIVLRGVARYTAGPRRMVEGYVHAGAIQGYGPGEGRIGVLVELGVEERPAVPGSALASLAHDLALHIAAAGPVYLAPDQIPEEILQAERAELMAQLAGLDKPEHIKATIVAGRLDKFLRTACLLQQNFIKDEDTTVETWLRQQSAAPGTPVTVNRFVRFEVGGWESQ